MWHLEVEYQGAYVRPVERFTPARQTDTGLWCQSRWRWKGAEGEWKDRYLILRRRRDVSSDPTGDIVSGLEAKGRESGAHHHIAYASR